MLEKELAERNFGVHSLAKSIFTYPGNLPDQIAQITDAGKVCLQANPGEDTARLIYLLLV